VNVPPITETERSALADELLAIRCQLGEPDAFDALVERWNPALWRYLRRLVGHDEDAADTLQEVWLRILRGLPRLRDPTRLRPWLFGIARRALMDRLRREYAGPAADASAADHLPAPEPEPGLLDDLDELQDELAAMPLLEREVLVLFYLQELPIAQVAEVLAVPLGTVKSRLFRARNLLRDRLEKKGFRND
jgi:RNA polymerase sigma-70 factor (ECF subfamily)